MNKQVYEQNLEALNKKYPAWAAILEEKKRKKRNFDVIAEESLMGDTILKVVQNRKTYYLNGKYAPSAVVERWLAKQEKFNEYTPIVIVGISNGYHIKKILEAVPKTANILIYEPSFEVFRRAMEEVDLSFLFEENIPVAIIVNGLNENECTTFFHFMISFDNMTSLKYYFSGNYKKLFSTEIEEFVKKLKHHVEELEIMWNTFVRYTNVKAVNTFNNLPYLYKGYSVEALNEMLPEDVPVIVVSAGPSLNKNLPELKKAVGKACIIATDTAMKPLLNAGIVPNLFVIIDGLKPGSLFEHKELSRVPMVTMTAVAVDPMRYHKGKKFFYYSSSLFEDQLLGELSEKKKTDCHLPNLPTGGSVANTAYSLGVYMGAKTIILVGQDLAMTGNRTHADGTFKERMDEIDVKSDEYFEVDAVGGGKVLTRMDFHKYRQWFEGRAKEWSHVTMVDATEGGALIHGAKVMTLRGAIKKYCQHEYNVKWHIDHTKKLFEEDDQTIALDFFENAGKKLIEVKKKAKEGLRYYERLEKLMHKANASDAELGKVLKRIKKVNNYIERDYMAETVMDSLMGVEYILRTSIYQMREERKEELMEVAQQGELLLTAVCAGADEIRTIVEETIEVYAKEERERLKAEKEKNVSCSDQEKKESN